MLEKSNFFVIIT